MTSTDQKVALVELFQAVYKTSPSQELLDELLHAQYKHFKIGEELQLTQVPQNFQVVLLQGKLRILHKNEVGINETVLALEEGSVFSVQQFMGQKNISIRASSKSLLCFLDAKVVNVTNVLKHSFSNTSANLSEALSRLSNETDDENENLTSSEDEQKNILDHILDHYNLLPREKNVAENNTKATNLEEAEDELKKYGFHPEKVFYTQNQLHSAKYPLVLEDQNGKLRLVTGSTGDSFIEAGKEQPIAISGVNNEKYLALQIDAKKTDNHNIQPFKLEWYLNLFAKHWMLSSQIAVSSIFIQTFALGMPFFYMVIFDRVFGHQNLSTLDIISIGMVLLMVFDLIIKSLQSYILSHQLEAIDSISSEMLISKLIKVPLQKISGEKTKAFSETYAKLMGSNQILTSSIFLTSIETVFSVFLVIILLCMHFTLTLISLAPLIPTFIYSLWTNPRIQKRAMEFNKDQKECQSKLTEILENSETIKSINVGRFLQNNLNNKVRDTLQKGFLSRFDSLSSNNVLTFISTLGSLVVLYYGAHEVIKGNLSYGIYLAINMLSRNVMTSCQKSFSNSIKLNEASENFKKIQELCKDDEEYNPISHGISGLQLQKVKGAIEVENLNFRYSDEAPWVFQNLNLKIEPGEKIVLAGKSGAGKTTLLRLLQRLYEPSSGYIKLDKYNIADIHIENLRKHIGVCIQKPAIFAGSIKDNIAIAKPYASMQEIADASALVGLDQILAKVPKGFDTPVLPMGLNLSGGQAALVALARVFLMNPSILVIDETLSPLDVFLKTNILAKILDVYKNRTCILVTNFIQAHQKADRIIVVEKGQVIEQGSYEDLIASQGYYYNLFEGGEK